MLTKCTWLPWYESLRRGLPRQKHFFQHQFDCGDLETRTAAKFHDAFEMYKGWRHLSKLAKSCCISHYKSLILSLLSASKIQLAALPYRWNQLWRVNAIGCWWTLCGSGRHWIKCRMMRGSGDQRWIVLCPWILLDGVLCLSLHSNFIDVNVHGDGRQWIVFKWW